MNNQAAAVVGVHRRLTRHTVPPCSTARTLEDDVRHGILAPPRVLPPKYFYDERGSMLFDQICDSPEYYLTRAEDALLASCSREIIELTRPRRIIEFGSGSARKTRRLFDACSDISCHPVYTPFDVCWEVLSDAGRYLMDEYAWLEIDALVGDYVNGLGAVPRIPDRRLFVFLGSTIGNLSRHESIRFLREMRQSMKPRDCLLLGADRLKNPSLLHAAYNDAGGLTREFNLNVLHVLNRELQADFNPAAFTHYAFFNPNESRVEMHLIATCDQMVTIQSMGESICFLEGDDILTEISCKYTRPGLEELLESAGLRIVRHYEAGNGFYSLVVAKPV
jgi:L-histidine N-alpha-methyltransferase